jgi:signal peptidase
VRTGIWSLIVVVVLAALGFAVFSVLSGAWMLTPILSGSMRPGLPVGGVAVSERVPASSLAVRDVIVFQNPVNPDVTMVHRIIQLNLNSSGQAVVKTQGDANTIPDPWTATLHGKDAYVVQFTIPLLGYPAVYTNHGVDLMVGGIILLMVVVGTVVERERRRRRDEAGPERSDSWHVREVSHSGADGDSQSDERVKRDVRSSGESPGSPPTVAVRGDSKAAERERPE